MSHVLFLTLLFLLDHSKFFSLFFRLFIVWLWLHLLILFIYLLILLHLLLVQLLGCEHLLSLSCSLCSRCGPNLYSSVVSIIGWNESLRSRERSKTLTNIATRTCGHFASIWPSSRFLCWLSSSTYITCAISNFNLYLLWVYTPGGCDEATSCVQTEWRKYGFLQKRSLLPEI